MKKERLKYLAEIAKIWMFPAVIYFVAFCILTWPLIFSFHTHFFADTGDGLQNVWNIWWINKAVTELHQNPWHTTFLHYPQGASLLGQTLNPFNGFIGIFLLKFLTLIETHNVIVLFSFVMGGVTAFWLSFYITKSYWCSLIAGYIFTFSQYHFAHAQGHLQLVSLEWIPLFVLCWYWLITNPGILKAIAAGVVLFAVLLCDYYYFLYCVLSGILIMLWYALSNRDILFFLKRKYLFVLSAFIGVCLITSGILIGSLLLTNIKDPFVGAHDPLRYSLDLLAPFIPGGHWRFAELTKFYWSRLPGNIHESSVYIGASVALLICYVWYKRSECRLQYSSLYLWFGILFFFGIMALGPVLHVGGKQIFTGIMPYTVLQTVIPPLKLSGCPARMMAMVVPSSAVISAIGLHTLFQRKGARHVLLAGILGFLLLVDFLPKPLPSSKLNIPEYIDLLKALPKNGGIIDTVNRGSAALYYQTVHEIPMADGYISRYPTSVLKELQEKYSAIKSQNYFSLLKDYNIHYIVTSSIISSTDLHSTLTLLYDSRDVKLYAIEKNLP